MLEHFRRFLVRSRPTVRRHDNSSVLNVEHLEPRSLPSATLISNIHAGGSSIPQNLVSFGGYVYFSADDGIHGRELWRTDGTAAGTQLVADLAPGSASSDPQMFTPLGSWLYFTAYRADVGVELWRTNGTITELVQDINP
ncbi:MAG: hypothetical protein RMJ19_14470, partial [Gemmatales bacterium]|nr:hypothetical protein [Gemmatales bacterium]MDW8176875.1 hypothetical protein [Gemmatales bacterium]